MKGMIAFSAICICLLISCKKKEDTSPQPNPAPQSIKVFTAKVNNQTWIMHDTNFGVGKVNALYYFVTGSGAAPGAWTSIFMGGIPSGTGTLNFSSNGGAVAYYYDESGHKFISRIGNINITTFDTVVDPLRLKNLKATFSFMTDTFNNISYDVTSGIIDIEN